MFQSFPSYLRGHSDPVQLSDCWGHLLTGGQLILLRTDGDGGCAGGMVKSWSGVLFLL